MTPTPADPGAIDLEVIRARYCTGDYFEGGSICVGDINLLIAAVETLRERVVELGNAYADSEEQREYDAKVAEARVVELAGALEGLLDACKAHNEANGRQMIDPHSEREARTALAAMPPQALERARAVDGVITAARNYIQGCVFDNSSLGFALDKLDAFGKEAP